MPRSWRKAESWLESEWHVLNTGDTVEWGHLAAGNQRYSDGNQYELLGDEVLMALPPPPPPSMPAAGGSLPQHSAPPAGEHVSLVAARSSRDPAER